MVADPIADLRSPEGSLISIYLERPSPGGFAALISDLGRTLRDATLGRPRNVQKSVEGDLRWIKDLAEDFEMESVPAYAVFASSLNDIAQVKPLAHPAASIAVLGSRPYMRPLRSIPRPIRTGIVVADRSQARVFIGFDGSVEEVARPLTADIGKPNYGGFAGYKEHSVRSRAQEVATRLWREAGEVLFDRHQSAALDLVLLGGREESFDDIRSEFHPYLRDLPQATFNAGPSDVTLARLRSELAGQRSSYRERRETDLVDSVLSAAGRDDGGLLGLGTTIQAVNAQAVADLVIAGGFTKPGGMCPACGYLDRTSGACPVCGAGMHDVVDVVSAVMDATVAAGGKVHQVLVGSPLDRHGVGALTRFEVAALD